jgi:hypothetical protein
MVTVMVTTTKTGNQPDDDSPNFEIQARIGVTRAIGADFYSPAVFKYIVTAAVIKAIENAYAQAATHVEDLEVME